MPENKAMRQLSAAVFVFLALCFSCSPEEPPELPALILGFPPAFDIKVISEARNPNAIFCRASIKGRIHNAVAIPPRGQLEMDIDPLEGESLRFSYGLLDQALPYASGPIRFYLKEVYPGGGERGIWDAVIDPLDNSLSNSWRDSEARLFASERQGSLVFGTDSLTWGAVISNPRLVQSTHDSKPSIIFILIDACRPDHLGCYGHARNTSPNLDALAARGTRFENVMTASPFTLTSVASIFSGLYPWDHGIIFSKGLVYGRDVPNMVELLRDAGYITAAFSGTYFRFSINGFDRGFDVFDETCAESFFRDSADCLASKAARWISNHSGEPFFIYMHLVDPHAPYYAPDSFRNRFTEGLGFDHAIVKMGDAARFGDGRKWYQIPMSPTARDIEYLEALYDGEISYADAALGRDVLIGDILDSARERAILLVTADHGEAFYEHERLEHRASLYDETLKVPLIIAGPGIPRGRVVKQQARTIDLMPTLLDLVGIDQAAGITGRSLAPALRGQTLNAEPAAALRCLSIKREHYEYALRMPDEKILLKVPEGKIEVYDLALDPGEKNDLSATDAERTNRLRKKLDEIIGTGSGQR